MLLALLVLLLGLFGTMDTEFTVGGHRYHLTDEEVQGRLQGFQPGPVHTHVVEVSGVRYPVKEALAHLTGLDPLDFNTNQARTVFKRLGFAVRRIAG